MDENTGDKTDAVVITNGDVAKTNGEPEVSESKSKVVEYDCQSADVTDTSSKVQKFSSKLKENAGVENGKAFHEKDYEESAQKSMQEMHGYTELGCSSSLQLAEKERVSETSGGGVKSEYTIGSDEQYKSKASSVNKVGDANIETHKSSDSSYTKACSKIEEELPGNSEAGAAAGEEAGRRVTEVSRGDYAHSEQISSNIEGPGGCSRSQGSLQELNSSKHSQSTVTTPSGSTHQTTTSEKLTRKTESFKMESSSSAASGAVQLEEGASAAAESATTDLGGPKEIKLSTKISSDDGDLLGNTAASSFTKHEALSEGSKFEHVSTSPKETGEAGSAALYNRQHPDATPSDNMSVSSMSSAHDLNDIKMSSASSSECAYSASKMETNEMDKAKDLKYHRKSTDSLVKRILGESETERKNRYKINMGDDQDENLDKDSLLQRRLASMDKAGRKRSGSGGHAGGDFYLEEFKQEEMTYSRKSKGRMNRQGSGDLDSPRGKRLGRPGSRGSFEYDDDSEDHGYGGGYRGRGRFGRQNYFDDDDVFGAPMPPIQPLFRDEEFEPQKRDETEEYVKEKTASIRGMVDRQTVVLENLRKASESFDELTDEIKNIRQAFIENQARRSMMFGPGEIDDENPPRDQPRGGQRARSRYVQEREEDYEYAMRDATKGCKSQYGADDYGHEQQLPGLKGRQKQYSLDDGKDDYGLSPYGKSRGMNKDLNDLGPRSLGTQDDYLSSYARSRAMDKKSDEYQPKSLAGQALMKKSYYSKEDYSINYNAGTDSYNRRMRGLGGRSKSLYDEASGGENEGYSLEDGGASRRGRIGLQRTQYDPLTDDITPKDNYGVSAYGSGGAAGAGGYTRVGDPLSASATSSAYSGAASSRSSYTSATSRLTSSAASASSSTSASAAAASSSTRPRFSRSRTLSDIDFDRGSSPSGSGQTAFQSRFLGKVRQRSLAGEDVSRKDKPFKSRFLRSSFDFGDGSDSTASTYTSSSVSKRLSSKTETTTESKEGTSKE